MAGVAEVTSRERVVHVASGWGMLVPVVVLFAGCPALVWYSIWNMDRGGSGVLAGWTIFAAIIVWIANWILISGFFTLQPNEARVLILFGAYKGTVRSSGFFWANPFYSNRSPQEPPRVTTEKSADGSQVTAKMHRASRFRISLRVRNMISEKLKVNDNRGNPVEIAAVIVWRVRDTAQAMFDIDNYENYVRIQSEAAIRHVATAYAYDHGEEHEVTLRSGMDEVSEALRTEVQARLDKAGVQVDETRIMHLAYAPEIAQLMLRRQQAEAVIAARQKIVHAAVSMVEMALHDLVEKQVVDLDNERKATMVSNLMVVLCGESAVHPVVNTGTLYT
jgi:regulator of protease activity HflC (stomatin/prohibitin superfamily)